MKTMNRILVLTMAIAWLTACSKNETNVNPTLSSRIAGDYTVTYLKENGKTFTLKSATKGTMKVVTKSDNTAQVSINVTNGNPSDDVKASFENVVLKDVGGEEVEMSVADTTIGKGGNNQLAIKINPVDGSTPYEFIGIK